VFVWLIESLKCLPAGSPCAAGCKTPHARGRPRMPSMLLLRKHSHSLHRPVRIELLHVCYRRFGPHVTRRKTTGTNTREGALFRRKIYISSAEYAHREHFSLFSPKERKQSADHARISIKGIGPVWDHFTILDNYYCVPIGHPILQESNGDRFVHGLFGKKPLCGGLCPASDAVHSAQMRGFPFLSARSNERRKRRTWNLLPRALHRLCTADLTAYRPA